MLIFCSPGQKLTNSKRRLITFFRTSLAKLPTNLTLSLQSENWHISCLRKGKLGNFYIVDAKTAGSKKESVVLTDRLKAQKLEESLNLPTDRERVCFV